MSVIDSLSSNTSRFNIRSERGSIIYNNSHSADVIYNYGASTTKTVLFTIITFDNALKVKIRDSSDYSFNYTAVIDWSTFDNMKREQSLDIHFEELQSQIVELLKLTISKQMLMRLEANEVQCKIVFYEKSRIKSLILLMIDLGLTNQKELVEEMSTSMAQLKDCNDAISAQLALSRNQLRDTEGLLKNAIIKNSQIEKQFRTDLSVILQSFLLHLSQTETNISLELAKLAKRHQKLLIDVATVKTENELKLQSSSILVQSLQNLRMESERNNSTIKDLKVDILNLNNLKSKMEQSNLEIRQSLLSKENEAESLKKDNNELSRDIQDATMIISQKSKINDEIGKDLVQANQMLVNFNNRYDALLKESDELRNVLNYKENVIREQAIQLDQITKDFEYYRSNYNDDVMKKLEHELFHAKLKIDEIEKQNKEALKLNGLLTKKLSSCDIMENKNINRLPPNF